MKVTVKKITKEQSVLEVGTEEGIKKLEIDRTEFGHSYQDFAEWKISDEEYYQLEEFVDGIMDRMRENNALSVDYDF